MTSAHPELERHLHRRLAPMGYCAAGSPDSPVARRSSRLTLLRQHRPALQPRCPGRELPPLRPPADLHSSCWLHRGKKPYSRYGAACSRLLTLATRRPLIRRPGHVPLRKEEAPWPQTGAACVYARGRCSQVRPCGTGCAGTIQLKALAHCRSASESSPYSIKGTRSS